MTPRDARPNEPHTPGPWKQDRYGTIKGPDGQQIIASGLALTTGYYPPEHQAFANARLIAAAPDLLEALLPFVSATLTHTGQVIGLMREDFERANAAIKKATGRE